MERDYVNWSLPQLECEYARLQQHEAEPYLTDDRRAQVRTVMSYIAFEGLMQQAENSRRQAEVEQLESSLRS